ncbi:MAG: pepF [Chloroflexi bacterium]|nr:pepF [Chloroflexota bacterium]
MAAPQATARPSRASVLPALTWDLDGLFPSIERWEAALEQVDSLIAELARYRGRLGESAEALLACMQLSDRIGQAAHQVYWFASNRSSEDQADPGRQALIDRATAMVARVNAASAFVEPELLALPDGTVESFLDSNQDLALYRLHLTDILAQKEHMLGSEAEEVLAGLTEIFGAPYDIYRNTANADIAFDPVTDEHGREVPMSLAALGNLLQSPNRDVRKAAYESAARAFSAHKRTIAASFAAAQKRDVVLARTRRYPSALAAALDSVHLPEELFHYLIRVVEEGTDPFRRYLEFRRRELGVERLMPYDLQAPLDAEVQQESTIEEASELVKRALAPLGAEYGAVLDQAFRERWVDWADNSGKRNGAYSSACYGYHPVILLNWQGKVSDTFTLAHELGHAVHSTLSTRTQPFVYSHYTLFLAEMASTTNELLLSRYLLNTTQDRALRRYVLTRALGSFNANFYGGASMAALQLAAHQMVENRQTLSYESITETSTAILKRWYGDAVEVTPEGMGSTWARAQHHFFNFYSYQYATGIAAGAAFADAIQREGAPAIERYLGFLSAGSSAHSIDILKAAGVDMSTPEPIERAVAVYDALERELEAL